MNVNVKMQKAIKNAMKKEMKMATKEKNTCTCKLENDLDSLIAAVTASNRHDLFSRERGSMIYDLEAEEIEVGRNVHLKNLEEDN